MADRDLAALGLAGPELLSTEELIERVLAAAREQLEMDAAFVGRFDGDDEVFVRAAGEAESFGIVESRAAPAEKLYCRSVTVGVLPNAVSDARRDARFRRFEVTTAADIGAYVGVPITFSSGYTFGTLCCLSHSSSPTLAARDVQFMRVLARLLAEQLERRERELAVAGETSTRIERVVRGPEIDMAFQPIVDLTSGEAVGVEALARFPGTMSTESWFVDAANVDLTTELELAALRQALDSIESLPDGISLSINVGAAAFDGPALEALLPNEIADRVVLEVTEREAVEDYTALQESLRPLRERGVRLAVDDIGSGFTGLGRIVGLRPEVLKLDLWLTRGVDADPVRRALASAAVAFAAEIESSLVAEGIETEAELDTLRSLGVPLGQGYHLARPAPLGELRLSSYRFV